MNIEQKVKAFFERNPDSTEVHTSSDGFLFRRKDQAKAHARTLKNKEVTTYPGKSFEKKKPVSVLENAVKDLPEALKDIKDIEVIDALIIQEQDNANRKGAIEVLEEYKESLKAD